MFGVFPFTFVERKILFSVARSVDCKLVCYCNIDVFLLVSHFLLCSDCSNLSKDVMNNCLLFWCIRNLYRSRRRHDVWLSTFLWPGLVERYGAIANRKKNVR